MSPCNLLPLNPQLSSLRSSYCLKFLTSSMLGLDLGMLGRRLLRRDSIFLQQTVEKRQFTEFEETSAQLEDFLHSPRKPSLLMTPRHGVLWSWLFSSSPCADLDIIWIGCLVLSSSCWRLAQSARGSSGKHSAELLTTNCVRQITKRLFILNYWLSCWEENFMSSVKPPAPAVRFPLGWLLNSPLKCFCLEEKLVLWSASPGCHSVFHRTLLLVSMTVSSLLYHR